MENRLYDRCLETKVLVVGPKLVAEQTWPYEAKKWQIPLRVVPLVGKPAERAALINEGGDVFTICRNNLPWLLLQYMKIKGGKWSWKQPWPFNVVVIDEASGFKNPSGVWFKAMVRVRRSGCQVIELTGTPSPKNMIDLWGQIYILDKGERLGDYVGNFKDKWMVPDGRIQMGGREIVTSWLPKPGAYEEVMTILSDICISLSAKDWLELPERIDVMVPVKMPPKARDLYNLFRRDAVLDLKGQIITAGNAANVIGKLLQIANGRVYDEEGKAVTIHAAKVEALQEIVEEADGNVLVFINYVHDKEAIKEGIPEARELVPDKWNRGEQKVAFTHPASTGHGLNLQEGGHTVVWYGVPYNLEWYQQANARLHRQGQTNKVIIHHLLIEDSIDEAVYEALQQKDVRQERILSAVRYR